LGNKEYTKYGKYKTVYNFFFCIGVCIAEFLTVDG